MTAHDKDPELRFVTAIFTYISYFVLIMVRTDTFSNRNIKLWYITLPPFFYSQSLVTYEISVVPLLEIPGTEEPRLERGMPSCLSRGRVSIREDCIIGYKIAGTAR